MKPWLAIALLALAPAIFAARSADALLVRRHGVWKILHIHASNIAPRR